MKEEILILFLMWSIPMAIMLYVYHKENKKHG